MPFILVGAPISALAFGLIPVASILPLFTACTVTLVLSIAFWRTPSAALMPDVTPPQFRSQANGIINFMGGAGAIVAYFGSPILARIDPAFPFWAASALVLFVVAILLVFLREPRQAFEADDAVPGLRESARELRQSKDKSALLFLFALACWMIGYSAIEGFWTLYSVNHLQIGANRGTSLLGMMSVVFVLAALPVGYLGARVGRKTCMGTGLLMMAAILATMYFLPVATLNIPLFSVPILGIVPVAGALLMCAGLAWALLIIHALPMIVDMTTPSRAGTYTGWYYGFSALASIIGPIVNGVAVQFNGGNYNAVMIVAPVFMLVRVRVVDGRETRNGKRRRGEIG
jgi:MFS family permease